MYCFATRHATTESKLWPEEEEEGEGELKLVLGQQLPLSHVTHCHTRPAESHGNEIFTGFSNFNQTRFPSQQEFIFLLSAYLGQGSPS